MGIPCCSNLFQMFEPPVTPIESKKQKLSFDDVDGSKVIGFLEKDSSGKMRKSPDDRR